MRQLLTTLVGVAALSTSALGAGAMLDRAPLDTAEDVAGPETARLLLIETIELDGERRWRPETLRDFARSLDLEDRGLVSVTAVTDRTGPALAVELGDEVDRELCVVADDEGLPTSVERACDGS